MKCHNCENLITPECPWAVRVLPMVVKAAGATVVMPSYVMCLHCDRLHAKLPGEQRERVVLQ